MSLRYPIAIGAALSVPLAAVFGWQAISEKIRPGSAVSASLISKETSATSIVKTQPALKAAALEPAFVTSIAPRLPDSRPAEMAPDALFAQTSPAVVRVLAQNGDLDGMQGSGFFISSDGVLVTNYHVIKGAEFASIIRDDETTVFVEGIVAQDPKADLAILKLKLTNVPFLTLGRESVPRVGTKVFAIGNPDGLTNTLSEGLISGIRDKAVGLPWIQTTAAISHGSSGGPLLATDGMVVGVTTATLRGGQNLNFAVPASQINKLLSSNQIFQKLASAGLAPMAPADTRAFASVYTYIGSRDFASASRQIELVRPTQQNNPMFWIMRGLLHTELNQQSAAMESFSQAERISPDCEAAWFYKGLAYLKFKEFPAANDALQSALHIKPHDSRVEVTLGWMQVHLHRIADAEQSFRHAIADAPTEPEGYNGLANVYIDEQRFPSAVSCAKKAVELRSDFAPAYLTLGTAYVRLQQYSEAQMAWQNAARFDPNGMTGRTANALLQKLQNVRNSRQLQ